MEGYLLNTDQSNTSFVVTNEEDLSPINRINTTSNASNISFISLHSKANEDGLNSVISITSTNSLNKSNLNVYFVIQHNKIKQNKHFLINHCPIIQPLLINHIKSNNLSDLVIEMPKEFTLEHIDLFNKYTQNNDIANNNTPDKLCAVLLVSIYYRNETIANTIINKIKSKHLTKENAYKYLSFAIMHNSNNSHKSTCSNHYWNKIINIIKTYYSSNNYFEYLNEQYQRDKYSQTLMKDIILDIITLYLQNKNELNNDIVRLFCVLHNNSYDNLLLLLAQMYKDKHSESNVQLYIKNNLPTIIELDTTKQHNEIEISLNNDLIIIVNIEYNNHSRLFDITFKLQEPDYYIFTILYFPNNVVSPFINFSQHYSSYSISQHQIKTKIKLYVHIEVDYIFTYLINYASVHQTQFIDAIPYVSELYNNFEFMLSYIKSLKKVNTDNTVLLRCIMLYYDNKICYNEIDNEIGNEISALLDNINFRGVKLDYLSEFYMKYHHIPNILKGYFNNIITIFKEYKLDKIILHCANKVNIQCKQTINNEIINAKKRYDNNTLTIDNVSHVECKGRLINIKEQSTDTDELEHMLMSLKVKTFKSTRKSRTKSIVDNDNLFPGSKARVMSMLKANTVDDVNVHNNTHEEKLTIHNSNNITNLKQQFSKKQFHKQKTYFPNNNNHMKK